MAPANTQGIVVPAHYRAYVYESYGKVEDNLQLRVVPTKPLPLSHVRIQVVRASLNPVDFKIVEFMGKMLMGGSPSEQEPYRIGLDLAGVVIEVGKDAESKFKIGDEVFTMLPFTGAGSFAEYVIADAGIVAHKPKGLTFDQAAAAPSVSLTSYQALAEVAKLKPGEHMLVLGGSSGTGMFAIQYAKAIGASVVATTSTKNISFVKSLGADKVVDYTTEKWSQSLEEHSVDVLYDCVGETNAWVDGAQVVLKKDTGRFVSLLGHVHDAKESSIGATFTAFYARPSVDHLIEIGKFLETGQVKPIVHSTYAFEEVTKAFTLLKTGKIVGKLVVSVQ